MAAWVFHVAALALAPISLVQSVIAGGLVLLTPMADRVFGLEVQRRDWIGVALTAGGLAPLAAALGGGARSAHGDYDAGTLAIYVGVLTVAAIACCVATPGSRAHVGGPVLAVSAGLLWGGSDVVIKAGSGMIDEKWLGVLLTPEALVITLL